MNLVSRPLKLPPTLDQNSLSAPPLPPAQGGPTSIAVNQMLDTQPQGLPSQPPLPPVAMQSAATYDPSSGLDETEWMRQQQNAAASTNTNGISPTGQPLGAGQQFDGDGNPIDAQGNQTYQPYYSSIPGHGGATGSGGTDIHPTDYNTADFQKFSDATYADMARQLDPQYAANQRAFEQQMVNQGLQPGTEAYDAAFANFTRSKNDAYDQARRSALASALAAQNQSFQQGATQAQINAALRQAEMAARAQTGSARISADAAIRNAQLNNQGEMERLMQQLGFSREQLAGQMELGRGNLDVSRGNLGVSQGQLGLASDQADFGNLMGLLGMYNGNTQYNNSLLNSDYSRGAGLLGLIPGLNPGNVDVTGAYGLQGQGYQNELAAYGQQQQGRNATYSTIGTVGAAALMVF